MKICHILYSGIGGHGTVVQCLLEGDINRRAIHQLLFCGVEPMAPEYRELTDQYGAEGHYVHYNSRNLLKTYFQVFGKLKSYKPDVVLLHSISLIVPVFIYRILSGNRIIAVEHQTTSFKRWTEWMYSRLILVLADAVVYLSGNYRNEIHAKLKVISHSFRKKMRIISNGINTVSLESHTRNSEQIGQFKYHAAYCSRFIPLKDFDTFVATANILNTRQPGKWRFTLAGDGPEMGRIKRLIADSGLADRVALPGFIDHEKIAELMYESDIYLHTSAHENMSTAILQAMAQKVPVVASDIPGNRVLIENMNHGILCPPRNPDAFAEACLKISENIDLRRAMTESAYAKVMSDFSHIRMFEEYYRLAEELVSKK